MPVEPSELLDTQMSDTPSSHSPGDTNMLNSELSAANDAHLPSNLMILSDETAHLRKKRPYRKRQKGEEPKRKSSRLSEKDAEPKMELQPSPLITDLKENDEIKQERDNVLVEGVVLRGGTKTFVEPSVAEPQAVYTGLPLEAFPPAKATKSTRGGYRGSSGRPATPDSDIAEKQKHYQDQLIKDTKTESSALRIKFKPLGPPAPKKRGRKPNNKTFDTPKQQTRGASETPGLEGRKLLRMSNRIKVISPKKHTATNLAPTSNGAITAPAAESEQTGENDDYCTTCGGSGVFICCDTCTKSFHFLCCDPPIEECPEDNWNCRECTAKTLPRPTFNYLGIFGQLVNHIVNKDPAEFQLPKRLRESFVGVTTEDDGSYADDRSKPELSFTKRNGLQFPGFNRDANLEVDSLSDKDGKPILCYKCKESGLPRANGPWRTMTCCDYCGSNWHIDCLDEPMCIPKTMGSKWMCPNHADQLLPNYLSTRRFKDATVVDASMHNHFVKIASFNSIQIKYRDQLYINDDMNGSLALQDYLQSEVGDAAGQENPNSHDGDCHPDFKIPEHLQTYAGAGGIYAKSGRRLRKVLTLTNEGIDGKMGSFVYRVPEELILLDFFTKVSKSKKQDIIRDIQPYEDMSRLETNEKERAGVNGLIEFKDNTEHNKIDFHRLVEIATQQLGQDQSKQNDQLSPSEIDELLQIKKLLQLKGKQKVVDFLTN